MPSLNQDHASDRLLHRLVDGDLSLEERVALLSVHGAAREKLALKLQGLGEVRALVRAAAEAELEREPLDADAMWAQISARVEGSRESMSGTIASPEPITSKPALQVIRGGRADERHERVDPQMDERQKRVRTRRMGMMLVGGLAAAAAIAIIYLNPPAVTEVATNDVPPVVAPELEALATAELQQTEVLAVDFGTNVGTVFSVEGDEGARYAVVWLTEQSEQEDDTEGEGADHGTKTPVEL